VCVRERERERKVWGLGNEKVPSVFPSFFWGRKLAVFT